MCGRCRKTVLDQYKVKPVFFDSGFFLVVFRSRIQAAASSARKIASPATDRAAPAFSGDSVGKTSSAGFSLRDRVRRSVRVPQRLHRRPPSNSSGLWSS